jgi:hypothetical protein
VKANSVKQEYEKQDELKRSAMRAVAALLAIPGADRHPQLGEFITQIRYVRVQYGPLCVHSCCYFRFFQGQPTVRRINHICRYQLAVLWIWNYHFRIRIRIPFCVRVLDPDPDSDPDPLWLVKSYGSRFGSDPKYSRFHNANNKKGIFMVFQSILFKVNVRLTFLIKLLIFWWFLIRCISCFGSGSESITSSYGSVSGSCKKFRILTDLDSDPDPQHCQLVPVQSLQMDKINIK